MCIGDRNRQNETISNKFGLVCCKSGREERQKTEISCISSDLPFKYYWRFVDILDFLADLFCGFLQSFLDIESCKILQHIWI